jgi:Glycosyltransferase family 87
VLNGLPCYTDHVVTVERYLGLRGVSITLPVNAHPPTSVPFCLPFGPLPFADAVLAWNVVSLLALLCSLGLVRRALRMPWQLWTVFPLVTLLLLCNPVWQLFYWGQWSSLLLLLLTGTWLDARQGRWTRAGVWLGIATALKLFPALLFLYFALQRKWSALFSGMITLAVLSLLTAAVLGGGVYAEYFGRVLPRVQGWETSVQNASLAGFWGKLFDEPCRYNVFPGVPLFVRPELAKWATQLCRAAVVLLAAWAAFRSRSVEERDAAWAVNLTAMLLVSPLTWTHGFIMLVLPLAVLWMHLPATNFARATFLGTLVLLWSPIGRIGDACAARFGVTVWQTLFVNSLSCYALVTLFGLGFVHWYRLGRRDRSTPDGFSHSC